jgi:hypothetical protein
MERMVEGLGRLDEGVLGVERVLEWMSRDEEEWARALSREMGEMDYWSGLAAAKEDGIMIGEKRGEKRGEEWGRIQEAQKAYQEKLAQARVMKADGLSLEQIEKYSGLSRGEIEALPPLT